MYRPKLPTDLNIVVLFGLDCDYTESFTWQIGLELVQVECFGDRGQDPYWAARAIPRTIAMHRDLLSRYSRKFSEPLRSLFETRVMEDCLAEINVNENKHALLESAPVGYIPTPLASLTEWRLSAGEQQNLEAKTVTHTTLRIDETPFLFGMFVQWAYTQELKLDRFGLAANKFCAALYGLSERLDIPDLRQQCFKHLRAIYKDYENIPDVSVAEVIIKQCSKTSRLRKYLLEQICECMMDETEKHLCEPILNSQEDFASEVANQMLANLRKASSAPPKNPCRYDDDDSDSDYSFSEEDDSESADDNSDVMMSDSEFDGSDTEEGDGDIKQDDKNSSDHGLKATADLAEAADAMQLDEAATEVVAEPAGTAIPNRDPENHSSMPTPNGHDIQWE